MSNKALRLAIALSILLALPASSFAGGFARHAGYAGTGSMPIPSIPHGPENAGGLDNATDRSDLVDASWMATLPQPHIAVPTQPKVSRNSVAAPASNFDQQSVPEAPVGHRQPRADRVPSEDNLMNPNDPINRENADIDRMLNICRGC